MAAQDAAVDSAAGTSESAVDSVREREIAGEQVHLDQVYRRLEEKIHEAEFLMNDAAKRGQVGTPGALAERDAQVFRAGVHLNRLNNEFEDFLFGRIDLLLGKDGKKGPDGAYTSVEPAEDAVRPDGTADIAETLHIGRIGVLDADYSPLVIDWRAPAAAPFYRSTPVDPGRVVRRRVIRSKGRKVLGVEDDLMRPELTATLDGAELPVIGDGALMAALGQARSHTMRDIVASIQAEQDMVIRAPAASVTYVEGGPGTGKTAVALHRAAYLLYQDRRRYAGGILIVSPTPLLVAYTEGVLPSLGEEGQVAIRAVGNLVDGAEATAYDDPAVARIKGSSRMLHVLRKAARGALEGPGERPGAPDGAAANSSPSARTAQPPARSPRQRLRVVAFGARVELEARGAAPHPPDRARRHRARQPAAPARPQAAARRPVGQVRRGRPPHGPGTRRRAALLLRRRHRLRGRLHRLPRRVVARADPARGARRDGRRAAARALGPPGPQPGRGAPPGPLARPDRRRRLLGARRGAAGRAGDAARRPGPAASRSASTTRWTRSPASKS